MTRRAIIPAVLTAAIPATAQTITMCAPVFGKYPTLCIGQCPACLKANGAMKLHEAIERDEFIRPGYKPDSLKVLRDCSQCHNAFWQTLEAE